MFSSSDASDVDECAEDGGHDCGVNAVCTNTPDYYTCTCNIGYTGNGKSCKDIEIFPKYVYETIFGQKPLKSLECLTP